MLNTRRQKPFRQLHQRWSLLVGLVLWLCCGLAWADPVAVAVAEVTITENDLTPFINESATPDAEACVKNAGTSDSVGYQPVLELIVPAGYTVDTFRYLGTDLTPRKAADNPCAAVECTLDSPLQATMPGRTRTIAYGEQYLTLEYPLGSFPNTQPKQCISFSLTPNSPNAVVGTPNQFQFTPIFSLGADELNNPSADPPIVGTEVALRVTPSVIQHTKTIIAPERETATGPSFKRTVSLTVDVANGATVSDVAVTDVLPNSFQFVQVVNAAGCSATSTPSTSTPGGTLTFNCGAITGTTGADKTITFEFYVPERNSSNALILNANNPGRGVEIENSSTASGTYSSSTVSATDSYKITAKANAIQKSVDVTDCDGNTFNPDERGPRPNDCLRYTIEGQISDYFGVDSAVLTDVLGDGQTFRPSFIPTWSVNQGGATSSGYFSLGNDFTAAEKVNGETTLTIDLSYAMSGGGAYEIVFESNVDDEYAGDDVTDTGTKPLSAGDEVRNTASVDSVVTGGEAATDETEASVSIEGPTFTKSIYAVNGSTDGPLDLNISPGETVTYRIQYDMPFVSFEDLTLTDYLPIPKLVATEVTGFDDSIPIPAAGKWRFHPTGHTAAAVTSDTITFSTDATQNTLEWSFGNVESQENDEVIDIIFTVTMTTAPIADQLDLANLVEITSKNSFNDTADAASVVNITTAEPILAVEKLVRKSGGSYADSVSDADAGDVIDYQITVTNEGNGPAHKIKLNDTAKSLSYYGDGASCTVTNAAGGSGNLFDGTFVLNQLGVDESTTITYQCTIQQTAVPNVDNSLKNRATVTEYYSAAANATNLADAGYGTLSDTATVKIQDIQEITQRIIGSSVSGTTFNDDSANFNQGETLNFEIVVKLSEGTYSGFSLTDSSGSTTIPAFTACGSDGFTCSENVSSSGGTVTVTGTNGSTAGTVTYTGITAWLNANGNNTATVSATNATTRTSNTVSWTKVTPAWNLTKTMSPTSGAAGTPVTVTLKWRNTSTTSPMFGCVITDTLPTDLFDVTSVAENGGTPAGYTFKQVGDVVTFTRSDNSACETTEQTATFTVNVKDDAVTGTTYTNQAAATAKTLPSDDSNIGSAGTVTKSASNTFAVTGASNAKVISAHSQTFTDNPKVAIGETVTYDLTFTLPKGITKNVVLADAITAGNIGDVALVGATLARSNTSLSAASNPGTINGANANTPVAVTLATGTAGGCPADGQFCLALGDVNNSTSTNDSDTYTLSVTLRIANVANNIAGHAITDEGRIYYDNASGTQQNVKSGTQTVKVALPQVVIVQDVTPSSPSAGDLLTYILTITNPSGTNATTGFDWSFTDILPVELTNPGGIVTNAGTTGATINASFSGNTLNGTIDQLDPGESVTITYTAQVNSNTLYGKTLTTTPSATATTLSGNSDDERTGAGGVNDITKSTTQSVVTSTPTLSKAVVDAQTHYAIGDIVHYRLTLGVAVGTTNNLEITDTLPAGLTFLTSAPYAPSITRDTGITTSFTYNGASPIVFDLDTVTATQSGNIVIDYYAQVANDIANQNGQSRTNVASASYDKPGGGTLTSDAANEPSITIGEPNLTMTKTIVSGDTGSQAGDTVRYKFTVENEGPTTAYQITVSDQLPAGLHNLSVFSVTPSGNVELNNADCSGGTAVLPTNALVSTTTNDDDTLTIAGICIAPGASLTVAFDAVLMDSVEAGQLLTNSVRANYASQPTGASTDTDAVVRDNATNPGSVDDDDAQLNNYEESASIGLTVDAPIAIDKQADKTQATIGELVTYTLKVSVIEGVTPSVVVTDVLPVGLTYVSHTISVEGMPWTLGNADYNTRMGTGQTVQFDLGDVSNPPNTNDEDDFVTIAIKARVDNITGNQAETPTVLKNGEGGTVTVQYGTGPTTVTYDYNTGVAGIQGRPLTIVEPALTLTKTANPTSQALGDLVAFTINLANTGTYTSDAFDLVVTDTLPTGLTYHPESASLPDADVTIDGQKLTFRISTLASSASTLFTYKARIASTVSVGEELTNKAEVTWKSLSGADKDDAANKPGRTGQDGASGLNNYTTSDTVDVIPTTNAVIDAVKTVTDSNGGVVAANDILEYSITLTNKGSIPATNVVFTDPIQANTAYVANSSTPSGNVSSGVLTVDVGEIAVNDSATIRFQVTIDGSVPTGTVISNQGSVDSDQTVPEPTDVDGNDTNGDQPTDVTVGQPISGGGGALYAKKTVNAASVATNGIVTYTITLTNIGSTDLTDLQFSDTVPAQITVTNATSATATVTRSGQLVTATLASLAPNTSATITITGTAGATTGTVNNQGTVTYTDGANPQSTLTDFDGIPSNGNQPTPVTIVSGVAVPQLDVQKRWALDTSLGDSGLPQAGDTLRYTLTIVNVGNATANDVRLTDSIPDNTTVVAGSVVTSQGAVLDEDPVSLNIGSLIAGARVTAEFKVKISTDFATGIVSNQATVTRTGDATGVKSDDNGNSADGRNPTLTPVGEETQNRDVTKTLFATSEADSADNNVLIGEVLTYQLKVNVPPGTTRQLVLVDTLPEGLAYVAGSGRLSRTFDPTRGLTASVNPANINSAASDVFVSLGNPWADRDLRLSLGDVINSDTTSASYTLEYKAVVQNVSGNTTGKALTNPGGIRYWNALSQTQTTDATPVTVTVIQPHLTLTKTPSPSALLNESLGSFVYTFRLENTGDAPAYDVNLTDLLAAQLPANTRLDSVTTSVVSGSFDTGTITDSSATNPSKTVSIDVASFPAGGTLDVIATLTTTGNITEDHFDNTATTTWTSLPGTKGTGNVTPGNAGDLTGERTSSTTGTGSNGYSTTATASIAVGDLGLTKERISAATPYAIGDEVEYRLTVSIPPTATLPAFNDVVLHDELPAALVYAEGFTLSNPGGLTLGSTPPNFTNDSNTLTADFGTVANSTGSSQNLIVTYKARVANVLGNQKDTILTNRAWLSFKLGGSAFVTPDKTKSITVGEPHLKLEPNVTPVTGLKKGDIVTYTVIVTNDGDTTAYETALTDLLPTDLFGQFETLSVTPGAGTSSVSDTNFSLASSGLTTSTPFDLVPGASFTLRFDAKLSDDVIAGQPLANDLSATYSSRDGEDVNERDDSTAESTQDDNTKLNNYNVTTNWQNLIVDSTVAIHKTFTTGATRYTLGETVSYDIHVNVSRVKTPDMEVTDELPAGLSYVSCAISVGDTDLTIENIDSLQSNDASTCAPTSETGSGPTTLIFDLGYVDNQATAADTDPSDEYVQVRIIARVDNSAGNQANEKLGNHASVSYTDGGVSKTLHFDANGVTEGNQPLELTITEPQVSLDKTASSPSLSLGDLVTFTLRLTPENDATGQCQTPYDLVVTDTLPEHLSYVSASPEPSNVNGQKLTFSLASLTCGTPQDIVLRARVSNAAVVGSPLTNAANLTWTSLSSAAGTADSGRTGPLSEADTLNDYTTSDTVSVTPTTNAVIDASKSVAFAPDGDVNSNGQVDTGDTLEYSVVLTNSGSVAATNVVFTDPMLANTEYVVNSSTLNDAAFGSFTDGVLTVDVGTLAVGLPATITFQVTVNGSVPVGTVISNQGSVDSDQTVPEPTDVDGIDANGDQPTEVTVGQPISGGALYARKTVNAASVATGGTVTYTI
ncbi:beta strand repeat-containing protein, partial [Allochromatium palmeri]